MINEPEFSTGKLFDEIGLTMMTNDRQVSHCRKQEVIPIEIKSNEHNKEYLLTKRNKLGHTLKLDH